MMNLNPPAVPIFDAKRLRELLHYDPEAGAFTWLVRTSNRIKIGDVAGCVNGVGYCEIRINKQLYLAHRLVFLWLHGRWPVAQIDHIDGNPTNNRIENLREATSSQNNQNKRMALSNNKSGLLGVSQVSGRWLARIKLNKKTDPHRALRHGRCRPRRLSKNKTRTSPVWNNLNNTKLLSCRL